MSDTDPTPTPPPAGPPLYALLTAAALLALYIGLTIAMMVRFAGDDKLWEHALLIYNGFTAFAVAAGGVLLGTQIQQANVAAARREAGEAKTDANRARQAVREALTAMEPAAPAERATAADLAAVRSHLLRAI